MADPSRPESEAAALGERWNRFWFSPRDPFVVSLLRALTGAMAVYFVASHSLDLVRWFGPNGILPGPTVQFLSGGGFNAMFHISYFYLVQQPVELWLLHCLGLVAVVLFAVGWQTRVTNVLALIAVLAYVHRAPMLTGPFEPVLTLLMFYLCFSPSGSYLSVDAWLRHRRGETAPPLPSWSANFAVRLIQVHMAAMYLMMALTKLAGETWWAGEAVWWLAAHSESRLADFTGLLTSIYLTNAATHLVVIVEMLMAVLIWQPVARRPLLIVSAVVWIGLVLVTGLISFGLIMLIANLAFVPAGDLRSWRQRLAPTPEPAASVA